MNIRLIFITEGYLTNFLLSIFQNLKIVRKQISSGGGTFLIQGCGNVLHNSKMQVVYHHLTRTSLIDHRIIITSVGL